MVYKSIFLKSESCVHCQTLDLPISPSPAIDGKNLEGSLIGLLLGWLFGWLSLWQVRDVQVMQSLPDPTRLDQTSHRRQCTVDTR